MKLMRKQKGQIFTLDAFLALLIVTIALGLIVTQIESIRVAHSNELQILSSDFAQIAVKRTLAVNEPNNISISKLNDLKLLMDNAFDNTNYEYEVEIAPYGETPAIIKKTTGCSLFNQTAITLKPVIIEGNEGYLKMRICK